MIVLCGIPSEAPLRLVVDAAEDAGVEHLVLNQRQAHWWDLTLDITDDGLGGTLVHGGSAVALEAISGVYVRLMDASMLPEARPAGRHATGEGMRHRATVLHEALLVWLEAATCRVANRPSAMGSNVSKPYQAQLIARAGFRTPPTLVTNDPAAVEAFAAAHGALVYKSTSSVRSIVQRLTPDRLGDLERVRVLPTQFQALVEGTDVRVHVVGSEVFATELRTDAVDYRYAQRDGCDLEAEAVTLPADVADRCRALSRALQLPLCGIDLRRSPDGSYTCFEVNPSPGYSYYEQQTGQPIARAIVDYLAGAAR